MDKKSMFRPIRLMFCVLMFFSCLPAIGAQGIRITGVVTDKDGPLPGVAISVAGTVTGVVSDQSGAFTIMAPNEQSVLKFSYVGYISREFTVGSQRVFNVTLEEDAKELEEVVVIGYGSVKKSDLTGSVVSVKASDLNVMPTVSFAEMLRGKAPGVQIFAGSGAPGSGANVVVRGLSSMVKSSDGTYWSSNAPLYIVDGMYVSNISDLNASDIESLEVLKDASAQAIYGSRAANGVFLITTKRGKDGKATVDFSGYAGVQYLQRNFDFYSPEEWVQLRAEARRTDNNGEYQLDPLADEVMKEVWASKKFVNWEDLMLNPDWMQKYDLSVRAGSEKTKVAASIGYFKQDGMIQKSGLERGTFRLNLDQKLHQKVNIGSNFAYTRQKRQVVDETFNSFITAPPLAKPYNDDGELQLWIINSSTNEGINPLWNIREYDEENIVDRFLMAAFADWDIVKGLKYRINANINIRNYETGSYQSKLHRTGAGKKGHGELTTGASLEYVIDNILTYNKTFAKIHDFEVVAVQSVNRSRSKTMKMIGEQFVSDHFKWNGIPDAEMILKPERSISQRSLMSYTGRLRYSLMDRYLFTATLRRDGSSVFGSKNNWGTFPSVAVAWKMHQENFLSDFKWLNTFKLRFGYGHVGNQSLSPYETLGVSKSYQMLFGDGTLETGYLPTEKLHNPYLHWESTKSTNYAVDFGFLNNRISGTIDYYIRNTEGLLMTRNLNKVLGYDAIDTNIGKVQNKGIELMISGDIIREKDLRWTVDLNFTANKNKIVGLYGLKDDDGNLKDDVDNNWFIGQPIRVYYAYKFGGIWQLDDDIANSHQPTAKPGQVKLQDLSGPDGVPDGKVTDDYDRFIYSREPKWFGSLTSNLKWKYFDLMLDFYTLQGGWFRNSYLYDSNMGGSLQGVRNGVKVNYWTPENPSNSFPRPSASNPDNRLSTAAYKDQSYIRLRAATLGFTLPANWVSAVNISNARLYVTGSNLWTKSDILSYSPEASTGSYPESTTVIFGINVSF